MERPWSFLISKLRQIPITHVVGVTRRRQKDPIIRWQTLCPPCSDDNNNNKFDYHDHVARKDPDYHNGHDVDDHTEDDNRDDRCNNDGNDADSWHDDDNDDDDDDDYDDDDDDDEGDDDDDEDDDDE